MNSIFLRGFTAELVKTAAIGETMLGQKVKGMVSNIAKRSSGIRARSKGGAGLKGVTKKLTKKAEEGDGAGDDSTQAGDVLRTILEEAQARFNDASNSQGYNDQTGDSADDPSYGAGTGPGPGSRPAPSSPGPKPSGPIPPPRPRPARPKLARVALPPPKAGGGGTPSLPPPAKAEPRRLPVDLD